MRLEQHNDIIATQDGRRIVAVVNPESAQRVLAGRGLRTAAAIAHGALNSPTRVRALGRELGLLSVETRAAREKGLLR